MTGPITLVRGTTDEDLRREDKYLQKLYAYLLSKDVYARANAKAVLEKFISNHKNIDPHNNTIFTLAGLIELSNTLALKIANQQFQAYLLKLLSTNIKKITGNEIVKVLHLFITFTHEVKKPADLEELEAQTELSEQQQAEKRSLESRYNEQIKIAAKKTEEFLLQFFNTYPELALKLPQVTLQRYAELSPALALKILTTPALVKILDERKSARIEIYKKHNNNLSIAYYALQGHRNLHFYQSRELHENTGHDEKVRPLPENWKAAAEVYGAVDSLEKEKDRIEKNLTSLELYEEQAKELQLLEKRFADYHFTDEQTRELFLAIKESSDAQQSPFIDCLNKFGGKFVRLANDDNKHKKLFADSKALMAQREWVDDLERRCKVSGPNKSKAVKNLRKANAAALKDNRLHLQEKFAELSRLCNSQETLATRTFDKFFKVASAQQAHDNAMAYVTKFAHYRVQFDKDNIMAMFAAVEDKAEFSQLLNCLIKTQNSLEILKNVLAEAANEYEKNNEVINLSRDANFNQRALRNIQKNVYEKRLLIQHEQLNGYKFISIAPEIASVVYDKFPQKFAQDLFNNELLSAENRLAILNKNRMWLKLEHLLEINKVMQDPKERESYFRNGEKHLNKTPLAKMREGIIHSVNRNPVPQHLNRLIIDAVTNRDLRGWLNLAKNPANIILWLTNTVDAQIGKYNNDASKIIAQDAKLMAVVRQSNSAVHISNNDYLFAANFVIDRINRSPRWFESGRQEDFINAFIDEFLNSDTRFAPNITKDQQQAVCWYIANNKQLNKMLRDKIIRKSSAFSFLGFGPTPAEIAKDESKLIAISAHFDTSRPPVKEVAQPATMPKLEVQEQVAPVVVNALPVVDSPSQANSVEESQIERIDKTAPPMSSDEVLAMVSKDNFNELKNNIEKICLDKQAKGEALTISQIKNLLSASSAASKADKQAFEKKLAGISADKVDAVLESCDVTLMANHIDYFSHLFLNFLGETNQIPVETYSKLASLGNNDINTCIIERFSDPAKLIAVLSDKACDEHFIKLLADKIALLFTESKTLLTAVHLHKLRQHYQQEIFSDYELIMRSEIKPDDVSDEEKQIILATFIKTGDKRFIDDAAFVKMLAGYIKNDLPDKVTEKEYAFLLASLFISEGRDSLLAWIDDAKIREIIKADKEAFTIFFDTKQREKGGLISERFFSVLNRVAFDVKKVADEVIKIADVIDNINFTKKKITDLSKHHFNWVYETAAKLIAADQAQLSTKAKTFVASFWEMINEQSLKDRAIVEKVIILPQFAVRRKFSKQDLIDLLSHDNKAITDFAFANFEQRINEEILTDAMLTKTIIRQNPYFASRVINAKFVSHLDFISLLLTDTKQDYVAKLLNEHTPTLLEYVKSLAPLLDGHLCEKVLREKLSAVLPIKPSMQSAVVIDDIKPTAKVTSSVAISSGVKFDELIASADQANRIEDKQAYWFAAYTHKKVGEKKIAGEPARICLGKKLIASALSNQNYKVLEEVLASKIEIRKEKLIGHDKIDYLPALAKTLIDTAKDAKLGAQNLFNFLTNENIRKSLVSPYNLADLDTCFFDKLMKLNANDLYAFLGDYNNQVSLASFYSGKFNDIQQRLINLTASTVKDVAFFAAKQNREVFEKYINSENKSLLLADIFKATQPENKAWKFYAENSNLLAWLITSAPSVAREVLLQAINDNKLTVSVVLRNAGYVSVLNADDIINIVKSEDDAKLCFHYFNFFKTKLTDDQLIILREKIKADDAIFAQPEIKAVLPEKAPQFDEAEAAIADLDSFIKEANNNSTSSTIVLNDDAKPAVVNATAPPPPPPPVKGAPKAPPLPPLGKLAPKTGQAPLVIAAPKPKQPSVFMPTADDLTSVTLKKTAAKREESNVPVAKQPNSSTATKATTGSDTSKSKLVVPELPDDLKTIVKPYVLQNIFKEVKDRTPEKDDRIVFVLKEFIVSKGINTIDATKLKMDKAKFKSIYEASDPFKNLCQLMGYSNITESVIELYAMLQLIQKLYADSKSGKSSYTKITPALNSTSVANPSVAPPSAPKQTALQVNNHSTATTLLLAQINQLGSAPGGPLSMLRNTEQIVKEKEEEKRKEKEKENENNPDTAVNIISKAMKARRAAIGGSEEGGNDADNQNWDDDDTPKPSIKK